MRDSDKLGVLVLVIIAIVFSLMLLHPLRNDNFSRVHFDPSAMYTWRGTIGG